MDITSCNYKMGRNPIKVHRRSIVGGYMRQFNIIFGVILSLIITGCAAQKTPSLESLSLQTTQEHIKSESEMLEASQRKFIPSLERVTPREVNEKPVMPVYDPLEDHTVSFSMINEDLKMILYSLSQSVGMNLIIDPAVNLEKRLLTLNFQNVSAATSSARAALGQRIGLNLIHAFYYAEINYAKAL